MNTPAPQRIRIGTMDIGLVGLDIALNTLAGQQIGEQEAVDRLFAAISSKNYIPPGNAERYRQALLETYRQYCSPEPSPHHGLSIRIFGSGCVSCNRLQAMVIAILDRLRLPADIEQIYDPDEIGRAGITMTPALMINGRITSSGILPTPAQVEQWIQQAVGS